MERQIQIGDKITLLSDRGQHKKGQILTIEKLMILNGRNGFETIEQFYKKSGHKEGHKMYVDPLYQKDWAYAEEEEKHYEIY